MLKKEYKAYHAMSSMDIEEMKDYISQKELEFALLEQSVSEFAVQCDDRINAVLKEKDTLAGKCSQLEILLKGRQGALIAKEEEIQRLRSAAVISKTKPPLKLESNTLNHVNVMDNDALPTKQSARLSISTSVPHLSIFPPLSRCQLSMVFSSPIVVESVSSRSTDNTGPLALQDNMVSPPRTAYKNLSLRKNSPPLVTFSDDSDGLSDFSPRQRSSLGSVGGRLASRFLSADGLRRPASRLSRGRESFSSMRSAIEEVFSDPDQSDSSLDELVTSTMRLSQQSFSSIRSSGVGTRRRW